MVTLTYQERFKTVKGVFDAFTNRNLFELQSRGHFDQLVSPLAVGKESNVFIAKKGTKKIIVKIYNLQNSNFNKMYDYIRKDPRYEFLKKHRRDIIFSWTQREYKNLVRAERAKINVPKVLAVKHNILVEEMIGDEEPAPPLKDHHPKDPQKFCNQVIKNMSKLYKKGLIHGDLSSFNILIHDEKPYFIDFSQATLVRTPNSEELLERDVRNIVHFFKKLGLKLNYEKVMQKITSSGVS
jgi:RIO kinase 1